MIPDTQPVSEFERGFAALLDVIDRLKKLRAPTEPEGVAGVIRWMTDFKRAMDFMPNLPDVAQLAGFAEDMAQSVSQVEKAVEAAGRGAHGAGRTIGSINTNQEPPPFMMQLPVQFGKVVALYYADMTPYTDFLAAGNTDEEFARYATVNPCDWDGAHTDTTVVLRVEFPPVRDSSWSPDTGSGRVQTGVPELAVGAILAFDQRFRREAGADTTGTGTVVGSVLTDGTKTWTADALIGGTITIAGVGYSILDNGVTTVTVGGTPTAGSQAYAITQAIAGIVVHRLADRLPPILKLDPDGDRDAGATWADEGGHTAVHPSGSIGVPVGFGAAEDGSYVDIPTRYMWFEICGRMDMMQDPVQVWRLTADANPDTHKVYFTMTRQ